MINYVLKTLVRTENFRRIVGGKKLIVMGSSLGLARTRPGAQACHFQKSPGSIQVHRLDFLRRAQKIGALHGVK